MRTETIFFASWPVRILLPISLLVLIAGLVAAVYLKNHSDPRINRAAGFNKTLPGYVWIFKHETPPPYIPQVPRDLYKYYGNSAYLVMGLYGRLVFEHGWSAKADPWMRPGHGPLRNYNAAMAIDHKFECSCYWLIAPGAGLTAVTLLIAAWRHARRPRGPRRGFAVVGAQTPAE